ncbi:MAG TPA: sigma-70 family RNA polymerase sigma factor [Ignavibacteriaceae bacterium]|nr:sigma-70 family RNA polymerase sigma factor [Ignavibacteriaceae bacterium]
MSNPVHSSSFEKKKKIFIEFEKEAIPHIDLLYNFALRLTGKKKIAVKLLMETYSKALWFFDHLDKRIEVKMWLFRVMRNAYFNSYIEKSEMMNEKEIEEIEKNYERIKSSLHPEEKEIYSNISREKISESLSSLSPELKILIILCDIFKFNYEEISDFVDLPLGVVVTRHNRARKKLFTILYNDK